MILDLQRPILLNGIGSLAERSDLLDRQIGLVLPTIDEDAYRDEDDFWAAFREARPRILGALLDAVSTGLRNLKTVKLTRSTRLAGFAKWITAAEPALPWASGEFMVAYRKRRADAHELALEASLIAPIFRGWITGAGEWEGTASQLLDLLTERAGKVAERDGWPTRANGLSRMLRRIAPDLRAVGIDVEFDRKRDTGARHIGVTFVGTDDKPDDPDDHRRSSSSVKDPAPDPEKAVSDDPDDPDDKSAQNSYMPTNPCSSGPKCPEIEIPEGWTGSAWTQELERRAGLCQALHPDKAAEFRRQAAAIRRQGGAAA